MQTKVSVKGAEFFSYHGYYEEERKSGNLFIVDAEVSLKTFDSYDDNISDTINYEQIYEICKQEMLNTQKLLETVVFNMINRFKNELPNISGAKVSIKKIAPQLGGKVKKTKVEMSF